MQGRLVSARGNKSGKQMKRRRFTSMAMQKQSCKNTPQYLGKCCSPIGQNNTQDFSAQSRGSIGRAV